MSQLFPKMHQATVQKNYLSDQGADQRVQPARQNVKKQGHKPIPLGV